MHIGLLSGKKLHVGNMTYPASVIVALCIFAFFPPGSLEYIIPLPFDIEWIYIFLRLIIGAWGVLMYLRKNGAVLSNYVLAAVLFCLTYAIGSYFTSIKLDYTVFFCISIVGAACFFEYYIKKYGAKVFNTVWRYFFLSFVLNLIFLILYPEGLHRRFLESRDYITWTYHVYERISFIGGDNVFMIFGMPLWFSGMVLMRQGYLKPKWFLAGLTILNLNIIYVFSVTSLLGVLVLDVMTILLMKEKPINISWRKVVLISAFANIIIVFFGTSRFIMSLVGGLFEKALTFSIRTNIWRECFELIRESPFFGQGNADTWYLISYGGRIYAAHNMLLAILVQGGITLLVCYLYLLYATVRGSKYRDHFSNEYIACALMLCVGIMGTAESLVPSLGFWALLSMVAASKYMVPGKPIMLRGRKIS